MQTALMKNMFTRNYWEKLNPVNQDGFFTSVFYQGIIFMSYFETTKRKIKTYWAALLNL